MRGQKKRGLAGNRSEPTKPLKHANKIIAHILSGMQVGAAAAILISMTGPNYQAVFTTSLAVAVLLLTWRAKSMMWTDNPVLDAEEWYCEQEHKQTLWENRCIKCDECGDPIDPNFDTFCYIWGEAHWHTGCLEKKLKKWIPDEEILEMVIDALDEVYKEATPEPEEDY